MRYKLEEFFRIAFVAIYGLIVVAKLSMPLVLKVHGMAPDELDSGEPLPGEWDNTWYVVVGIFVLYQLIPQKFMRTHRRLALNVSFALAIVVFGHFIWTWLTPLPSRSAGMAAAIVSHYAILMWLTLLRLLQTRGGTFSR